MGAEQSMEAPEANQWQNETARKQLQDLWLLIGSTPLPYDPRAGGLAKWDEEALRPMKWFGGADNCFAALCVQDQRSNFFMATVQVNISPDKLCPLLQIADTLSYDQLNGLLSARSDSINTAVATLWLASEWLANNLVVSEQLFNDTLTKAAGSIGITSKLYTKMCENIKGKQQSKPANTGGSVPPTNAAAAVAAANTGNSVPPTNAAAAAANTGNSAPAPNGVEGFEHNNNGSGNGKKKIVIVVPKNNSNNNNANVTTTVAQRKRLAAVQSMPPAPSALNTPAAAAANRHEFAAGYNYPPCPPMDPRPYVSWRD